MRTNAKNKVINLKPFFKLLIILQKNFDISYVEIDIYNNDSTIRTSDDFIFMQHLDISNLTECQLFVTHNDVPCWKIFSTKVLDTLDKLNILYVIDDYCHFETIIK